MLRVRVVPLDLVIKAGHPLQLIGCRYALRWCSDTYLFALMLSDWRMAWDVINNDGQGVKSSFMAIEWMELVYQAYRVSRLPHRVSFKMQQQSPEHEEDWPGECQDFGRSQTSSSVFPFPFWP